MLIRVCCIWLKMNWIRRFFWFNVQPKVRTLTVPSLRVSPIIVSKWAFAVTTQIFPSVDRTKEPDKVPRRARGCGFIFVWMCIHEPATHTPMFTCTVATICLPKHPPLSGSEPGSTGAVSPGSLVTPNRLYCDLLCSKGFEPTNWPVCWKVMRIEGPEETGREPTGWHENRRGCQLARRAGIQRAERRSLIKLVFKANLNTCAKQILTWWPAVLETALTNVFRVHSCRMNELLV